MSRHAGLLAAFSAFLPACSGCHASKPYTPYTLDGTPDGSASARAFVPIAGDAGASVAAAPAQPAPGDGKIWPLEGGVVEPPAGHAFGEGIVADFDGDGKPDLVAWARSPDGARGELWFAPGASPSSGRVVTAFPADLGGAGCKPKPALTALGSSMLAFDFDPRCTHAPPERAARWVAVFRAVAGGPPQLGFEIHVGATPEGEALALALDGKDRDGDGRGDLAVTFTLEGAPKPFPAGGAASATVAFFDRPAGLSRDPAEPAASFKALGAALVADGRRKTTASRVGPASRAARRLHAMICEARGAALVTTSAGPIHCDDDKLAHDADTAEVEAAVNLGDPLAAFAALGRVSERRKDLDALVAKSIPSVAGKLVRTTAAAPDVQPPPAFGPVAILSTGDVLVRARDRILRVDHASFQEASVEAALRWPSRLAGAGDPAPWTLTAIERRCDAPTLLARFALPSKETVDVPLPALVPASCTASSSVPATMLGSSTQGALFEVDGEIVAVPSDAPSRLAAAESLATSGDATAALGTARSSNGQVIALPAPGGVLVATLKGQGRVATAKLWTTPARDGAFACAPSDDASRIACVVKNAVAIYDAK